MTGRGCGCQGGDTGVREGTWVSGRGCRWQGWAIGGWVGPWVAGQVSGCQGRWATSRLSLVSPHLPAVTELLDLLLQLGQRLEGLGLAQGQRLQLLLQPHHVVLVWQQRAPLRGHGDVGGEGPPGRRGQRQGRASGGDGAANRRRRWAGMSWGGGTGDGLGWWHWMSLGTPLEGETECHQGHLRVVALGTLQGDGSACH